MQWHGMHSHIPAVQIYPLQGIFADSVEHRLSTVVGNHFTFLEGSAIISEALPNNTITSNINFAGSIIMDGRCSGR